MAILWQLWPGLHGNYGVYMYMAVMGSNVHRKSFSFFLLQLPVSIMNTLHCHLDPVTATQTQ